MLWLCLRLPRLPLECLPPGPENTALAVIEDDGVMMANPLAAQSGVAPGQSIQTARSLCGQLHCLQRDPALEQAQLRRIALWAYRFSGTVNIAAPDAVVMELASSLRLFRNLARLYRRLIRAFRQRQLTVYSAVADTPLAAEWLSLSNPSLKNLVNAEGELQRPALAQALAALPVARLPFAPATQEMLHNLGLSTLGQLQALPLASLNQRLGPELGRDLQRLRGDLPDPREPFLPAETFSAQRHFEGGLNSTEQLRFPVASLLDELKLYLQCRQCLNRDLHWQFDFLDGGRDALTLELSHRHFNKTDVLELTMLRLESLILPGPVETLTLCCEHFLALQAPPRSLFDSAATRQQDRLPALLDKLRLRLSAEAVAQYLPVDAHLPELGWQSAAASPGALLQTLVPSNASSSQQSLRPGWLVHPPQAITQRGGQLYWRGALQLLQGPERLDSHWWQQRQARDYYIARHDDGRLCWLYRDGLTRAWYLHGFFAQRGSNTLMTYAELHCLSNFSFLRGASHPGELVARADELGYRAIAITDECSLAGIVRAWNEARERQIKLICGAEFYLEEGFHLVLLAPDRRAYAELCALISQARLHSAKGEYRLNLRQLRLGCQHCLAIWRADARQLVSKDCDSLLAQFSDRLWLGFNVHHQQRVEDHYLHLYDFAHQHRLPMVACGGVLMHERHRKPLQDVLTAIRLKSTVSNLGTQLLCNSEAFLKPIEELKQRYPLALLEESCRIADRCQFQLDELSYQYPEEALPQGQNPTSFLRRLTYDGARQRWPKGTPDKVREQIERELALIAELEYEHYFLTVHDIVQFARQQHILCQGRGSAANSAVCYCLFITEVDPQRSQLLFERFISRERKERPDIDVDFEHERREEVIQYIYRKYGRRHAALSATVITYRLRSAIRDVGKAMGLDQDFINRLMENLAWWDKPKDLEQRLQSGSLDIGSRIARDFMTLVVTLMGFPRHLSQHVGGFVIAKEPIATLVPQENAAMAERTIIQWDKDDLESLGMMKIDILALGMLSALRKSLDYISDSLGAPFSLQDIPGRDPATYQMLSRADSIGVFQVESRAQMTMLPRLQPRHFYDLVIQIAIIRPGPIQGGMVHPFLRRRQGLEPVVYENDKLKGVLERTLGIPIFQEQVIQLAMVAANFSGGEADQLRRAMASWGKNGNLLSFRDKLVDGMVANGYDAEFAERLFSQMKGFGAYGFPESHSASFALLAYASAWIKRHYPAEFFCGLLNSLPMGFYAPAQLIQDAKRHGVEIRAICINHSHWDHQLEYGASQPALRLGLRLAKGLQQDSAERLCAERQRGLFTSPEDFTARVPLNKAQRQCLIRADALHGFELHRYQSLWRVAAMDNTPSLTPPRQNPFDAIELPGPGEFEDIRHDYRYTGVSLRRHPLKLLRRHPAFEDCFCAEQLAAQRDDSAISIAGLVTCRQRPGTASGVLFLTLEDETGNCNVVVWADLQQRFRREILTGQLLKVCGRMQKTDNPNPGAVPVIHVVARHISEYNALLEIDVASHDFH